MSSIPKSLKKHLSDCVQCTENCPGIRLAPDEGVIPRGFCYGSGRIKEKELVLIFPEPHHNRKKRRERDRYREAECLGGTEQVAEEVDQVTREYFTQGEVPFHTRTMDLLREVFGTPDEIFRHCYFTELTKCEKRNKGSIPTDTRKECLELYLKRELEIIKPKAVVLFGEVKRFKSRIDEILGDSGRTVLAAHPSARPPSWLRVGSEDRAELVKKIYRILDRARTI